jgi:hypothetical protein
MPRIPDLNSPAREGPRVEKGDCIAEIDPDLLKRVWRYHQYDIPPDTLEPVTPLPERESDGAD